MQKNKRIFDGKRVVLFYSNYGNVFWASTLKELKSQIPGKVSKMYVDTPEGVVMHTGYVIGKLWLTAFAPLEVEANI